MPLKYSITIDITVKGLLRGCGLVRPRHVTADTGDAGNVFGIADHNLGSKIYQKYRFFNQVGALLGGLPMGQISRMVAVAFVFREQKMLRMFQIEIRSDSHFLGARMQKRAFCFRHDSHRRGFTNRRPNTSGACGYHDGGIDTLVPDITGHHVSGPTDQAAWFTATP